MPNQGNGDKNEKQLKKKMAEDCQITKIKAENK